MKLGIMQGRLTPPYQEKYQAFPPEHWSTEFLIAKPLGFECIEFIYDDYKDHPFNSSEGIRKIKNKMVDSGVYVYSICADYFMKYPIFDKEDFLKNQGALNLLIYVASALDITDIIVPCVDSSAILDKDDKLRLIESIRGCLPIAKSLDININLETDLPPEQFKELLDILNHPNIKVNYDTGNSAALEYNPEEELGLYGDRISVLHIKDRIAKNGPSVELGTGDVDFEKVFNKLRELNFDNIITMQAARRPNNNELEFVVKQMKFLEDAIGRWLV